MNWRSESFKINLSMKKKPLEVIFEEEESFRREIEKARKKREEIIARTKEEIEKEREKFLEEVEREKKKWLEEGILEIEKKCERLKSENEIMLKKMRENYIKKKNEIVQNVINYILFGHGD